MEESLKDARFRRTLAFALGALIQATRLRGSGRITLAALGFVGVLGAGFNGGSFLNYHQDFSSMLMAVGSALAMSVYVALLYRSGIATPVPGL
ncbi:MAG: hypothetical protein QOH92_1782 [Chloroflexota bacterium]|jgi:hypothetical protein|nr:hypothetical protein [Chloroflexota bacterium]